MIKYPTHVFFGYEDRFLQLHILSKFLETGIKSGGKGIYIVSEQTPYNTLKLLNNCGMDALNYSCQGQLEILSAEDTYLADNHFSPQKVLKLFLEIARENLKHGFKHVHFAGEMLWAYKIINKIGMVLDYEKMINPVLINQPIAALCMYNLNFFSPETIHNFMVIHPQKVDGIDGRIIDNVNFVPEQKSIKKYIKKIIKRKKVFGKK
ncbi:MAG: MEDS domain-containing protein [Elusimicrobiota bacterium]